MEYEIKTIDGRAQIVNCDWLEHSGEWIEFYRGETIKTLVTMHRGDSVSSVTIVE